MSASRWLGMEDFMNFGSTPAELSIFCRSTGLRLNPSNTQSIELLCFMNTSLTASASCWEPPQDLCWNLRYSEPTDTLQWCLKTCIALFEGSTGCLDPSMPSSMSSVSLSPSGGASSGGNSGGGSSGFSLSLRASAACWRENCTSAIKCILYSICALHYAQYACIL